jgi:hypothetical protein
MSHRTLCIAGLLLACTMTAYAAKPETSAKPAVPATPGGPHAGGSPATPAVPADKGVENGNGATPATPAVPGGRGVPATPATPATPRSTPTGLSAGHGSSPTCGETAPSSLAATWACAAAPDTGNVLTVSWSPDGMSCVPTKYALSVSGLFTDPTLDPPEPCSVQVTSHYTVFAPETSLAIAWEDLQDPDLQFCADIPLAVKVKALTTAPRGPNRSQNNAFATAEATGDAAGDACPSAP